MISRDDGGFRAFHFQNKPEALFYPVTYFPACVSSAQNGNAALQRRSGMNVGGFLEESPDGPGSSEDLEMNHKMR